ncbi:Ubiquinone biosynthesis protein COQ4 -like protein, mitochondrial [Rhizoctonia solani]|uniref:4-hydroxy-3-methoxy-5-polyprenylbenzoate decarboxylase n=1 Tax=Rhizoctonia solani TaxID=456999 RepID=A0A8H7IAA9_9AGAM|nr:Ubiquinone biosynthesis protein COQ4 -like protein, mitochondrial [Rhizoctonia solani]
MLSLSAKRVFVAQIKPLTFFQRGKATPAYDGHIPLNWGENAFMAVGSALAALADPRRGDMVAALGETTAGSALPDFDRPRVNTNTVDMVTLAKMPIGSWGHTYVTWLDRCGVTPDTREPVHYIDDPELAYVMTRYRESLKVFELANFGLPSTALSALSGLSAFFPALPSPTTLAYKLSRPIRFLNPYDKPPAEPKRPLGRLTPHQRDRFVREFAPWAFRCGASARPLITVYWEKRWDQPIDDLKRELGIWVSPLLMFAPHPSIYFPFLWVDHAGRWQRYCSDHDWYDPLPTWMLTKSLTTASSM